MSRIAAVYAVLTGIAVGIMGCGGGGGGGGGPEPTPAPPADPTPSPSPGPPTPAPVEPTPRPTPGPPTTTTITTTVDPEDIPNPFCGSSEELSKPLAPSPLVGQPIGWQPTGEHVGTGKWCQAEVPQKNWNLKDYCGTSTLKTNGTVKAAAGPEVKVLTYNLYWWNLYGQRQGNHNSAGINMHNFAKDKPYDLIGFQECEDMPRVLNDMKSAGITTQYTQNSIGEGYVNVCMAYATDVFTQLGGFGRSFVAEDQQGREHYGKRVAHWVRLQHKASGKKVFFINHHGPTPPGTGGDCGNKATAYNLLKVIAENAMVGDSVIFIGDFNAPWLVHTSHGLVWAEENGVISCHIPHVFSVPTLADINGVDNFFSTCTNMKEHTIMEKGGSDHNALNAVFELTGPSASDMEPDMVV